MMDSVSTDTTAQVDHIFTYNGRSLFSWQAANIICNLLLYCDVSREIEHSDIIMRLMKLQISLHIDAVWSGATQSTILYNRILLTYQLTV